jgi:hypothetical protein
MKTPGALRFHDFACLGFAGALLVTLVACTKNDVTPAPDAPSGPTDSTSGDMPTAPDWDLTPVSQP